MPEPRTPAADAASARGYALKRPFGPLVLYYCAFTVNSHLREALSECAGHAGAFDFRAINIRGRRDGRDQLRTS